MVRNPEPFGELAQVFRMADGLAVSPNTVTAQFSTASHPTNWTLDTYPAGLLYQETNQQSTSFFPSV